MALSFIVAPAIKYFFNVELQDVTFELTRPNPNDKNFKFTLQFDNYRTIRSGVNADKAIWPTRSALFVYETLYPHLLLSKLCKISLHAQHSFIGEASVDLLTLATGPSRVSLSLFNGDVRVGRVSMRLVMNEVCQTTCRTLECKLVQLHDSLLTLDAAAFQLVVTKRATEQSVECGAPTSWSKDDMFFQVPDHLFALDSSSMLLQTGYRFDLNHKGQQLAQAVISFEECLSAQKSLIVSQSGNAAPHSLHEDSAELRLLPPLEHVGKHVTEREFDFSAPLYRRDAEGNVSSTEVVGKIIGKIHLNRTLTFAQMPDGWTVDGVVVGEPLKGFVRPPFLESEMTGCEAVNEDETATTERDVVVDVAV